MDINQHKLTNRSWDAEMAMEDQIFHDPVSFSSPLFPSYSFPLQTNQIPPSSSSSQIPPSATFLFADQIGNNNSIEEAEEPEEELGAMKEMMYRIAAMQPVDIDPTTIHKPKRRNIRISDDPQSVAARHRRERISEKIRILQRLVPGGTKMDTASMLDEAIRYVKFLKRQICLLQSNQCIGNHWQLTPNNNTTTTTTNTNNNNSNNKLSLGTTSSTAGLDPVIGLTFNGNRSSSICFNHHEVD